MARYEWKQETRDGLQAIILRDGERLAEAVIYPELGCNCVAFRTTPDGEAQGASGEGAGERSSADVVDVFVPPSDIPGLRQVPFTGGNPILFPFPNRVRDGVYTFAGQTYRMDGLMARNWDKGAGQALHGLVGDKPWKFTEGYARDADDGNMETGASARFLIRLHDFPDIVEQYPFPCTLSARYVLRDGVLIMQIAVTNEGVAEQKTMPMGFGIHPWFPTSLRPGASLPAGLADISMEQRARSLVHVPTEAIWELEKLMPTGNVLPVEKAGKQFDLREFTPLAGHFFDHVFTGVQHGQDGWSEGGLRDPESGLEMVLAADQSFREWVLYAPLDSPVIALEPYTCPTDAVNLQAQGIDAGLIALAPGETWTGEIRFGLRRTGK